MALEAILRRVLRQVMEASVDTGVADATSIVTRLDDTSKSWPVNAFTDLIVEITAGTGEGQIRKISANAATSITPVTNFTTAPDATSQYRIGFFGKMTSDITSWGGTGLTGRDISGDLQALTDDSITGLLKSIGDVAALENLITRIGQTTDAMVAAGATGSVAAKLRRITQGLEDLKTLIVLAQLPAALSAGGNLKLSHEEAAIAVPADIQARYNVKSIRDIAPGAPGTFWLPETGNIDLSNFVHSSWYIYAPTTATMVVNCYLNISHDGGTTWRRAAGYEILDGAFVRDVWNSIDVPLMLCEAKLEVVITVAHPATLDLMCIRKA